MKCFFMINSEVYFIPVVSESSCLHQIKILSSKFTKHKMNSVTSVLLKNVDLSMTAKQVTDFLYGGEILTVSKITMIHNPNELGYQQAFIEIGEWHDNERAYQVVNNLNNLNLDAPFCYIDTDSYVFQAVKSEGRTYDATIIVYEEDQYCEDLDEYLELLTKQDKMLKDQIEEEWLRKYEDSEFYEDLSRAKTFNDPSEFEHQMDYHIDDVIVDLLSDPIGEESKNIIIDLTDDVSIKEEAPKLERHNCYIEEDRFDESRWKYLLSV